MHLTFDMVAATSKLVPNSATDSKSFSVASYCIPGFPVSLLCPPKFLHFTSPYKFQFKKLNYILICQSRVATIGLPFCFHVLQNSSTFHRQLSIFQIKNAYLHLFLHELPIYEFTKKVSFFIIFCTK